MSDAFENQKFKKGQSGNPDGARLHDPEKKAIARMTNEEVKDVAELILRGSMTEIKTLAQDDNAPMLKRWIATVIIKSMAKGDFRALDAILDRLVGKVKQVHSIGQDPNAPPLALPPQIILTLPDNGRSVKKPDDGS